MVNFNELNEDNEFVGKTPARETTKKEHRAVHGETRVVQPKRNKRGQNGGGIRGAYRDMAAKAEEEFEPEA